mmetsp:Transcript_18804/g.47017  ORF Transcript_18804/g.47017 Transcript_18804/m.47017 type:complete len:546 (+) Transcript_18804:604-2241(+)|eukprot:CAMPEP_0178998300 /NCGR_PEP_ID=MMETSP0795-20121207/9442_1 /TAXON_ID=88552 /ORGANISM="Amoebophrya sp., Strain Ameob2" /LENGTH=545 /DNA_ID=CAMNT_0020690975 /DNA_START=544 /DNA_END=2181 /DNA_ORIENTATION=-
MTNFGPFVPWEIAEDCAKHTLDEIVEEGGEKIHYHRLAEKSTPFAAKAVTKTILSQVGIAFVRHESLENDLFHKERIQNVNPNPADYWGRMLRPVMPVDEHERRKAEQERATGSPTTTTVEKRSPGGRTKKGSGSDKSMSEGAKDLMNGDRDRKTRLPDNAVEDEEENKYRSVKEREEKAKTEAILKAESDKKQGEEQKKRSERLLEQMAQQSWTFDTGGKLMWVESADGNKLPKVVSEITSKGEVMTKKTSKKGGGDSPSTEQKSPKQRSRSPPQKKKKGAQFTDGFTRLQSEQPPITETMSVRAGVCLMAKGQVKKGAASDDPRMSRAQYLEFLDAEQSGNATGAFFQTQKTEPPSPEKQPELPPLDVPSPAASLPKTGGGSAAGSERGGMSATGGFPLSAPVTTKDWRLKRDAIGNLGRFPRHHVGLLGTTASAGFARCLPQPPLGATMGHGLRKSDPFFFPDTLTGNEFERTMSRASTTGKSFYRTTDATAFSDVMERDRRDVIKAVRRLDIRKELRSGGGRMQTREKGRAILEKAMGRTQ